MDLVEVSKKSKFTSIRHPWEMARLEVVNYIVSDTLKNEKTFTVLDIGCGDIFFITELSKKYPLINFYAIDIAFTDELIEAYKKQAGNKIHLFKSLEEASLHMDKPADLVLLLDVIEHIENDVSFLNNLCHHKRIGAETQIIITVPAFQGLFCSHDHFLGHYRRYNNQNLEKTILEAGFSKIKKGYFFTLLILPRLLQVVKESISRPNKDSETTGLVEWNKGKVISGIIKNVLINDYKVGEFIKKTMGLNIPGLSNYILCKKKSGL
jgi:hypothetical protein